MATLVKALHIFVFLLCNHVCGKPNYGPSFIQETMDPVGTAIVTCHNVEPNFFGFERILTFLSRGHTKIMAVSASV